MRQIPGVYEFSFGDGPSGLTNQYSVHIYRISDLKVGCGKFVLRSDSFANPEDFPFAFYGFALFEILQSNHEVVGAGNLASFVFRFVHKRKKH
tara:strand:- start:787 stop:1065 length:279 start_codon:yes stop_codon:yes gene_type:complete